jgi:quercetin dioxygenase-like cupin family protein
MKIQDVPFSTIDWSKLKPTVQPDKNGDVISRTFEMGNIRVRMVEFPPGYQADEWCSKGHVVYVLEGDLVTELADGQKIISTAGTSFIVADDHGSHRGSTKKGVKLLIVD